MNLIQKYHNFSSISGGINPDKPDFHLNIKYVELIYDTRTGKIGIVILRGLGLNLIFQSNFWQIHPSCRRPSNFPTTLYLWLKKFLNGDIEALAEQEVKP